jgi:ribose 5-phosphate isomerase A
MQNETIQHEKEYTIEQEKKAAAIRAADLIPDGKVIGLGSGSTIAYLIEELGRRKQAGQIDIQAVASSYDSQLLAIQNKIPLLSLTGINKLAVTIDGADEIDKNGTAIKGKGGAHTLEKVLASLSEQFILAVDSTKLVETLGSSGASVPIELIPESLELVRNKLTSLGCKSSIRFGTGKLGPVRTDMGNIIIDAYFESIAEPQRLSDYLNNIPGVLAHGLFVNMVDQVVIGFYQNYEIKTGIQKYQRNKDSQLNYSFNFNSSGGTIK